MDERERWRGEGRVKREKQERKKESKAEKEGEEGSGVSRGGGSEIEL